MKLPVRLLEKFIEIPECPVESAERSELRHLLDDIGLEVKGVETDKERGVVFTIETLANRGDHLSVLGIAREISGRTLAQVRAPSTVSQLPDKKASVAVRRITEKCPRYAVLEMSIPEGLELRNDITPFIDEPGKHHALVDILNYVQLEMGQPMHAFDFDKIEGELSIDVTNEPETIDALDGKSYRVPPHAVVIKDKRKIVAVAGVIGCANSMVTGATRKVLIESATFDRVSVRVTARAMGLSTDASYAFERGSDPEGLIPALKRVVYLASGSAGAVKDAAISHPLGLTYVENAPTEKRKIKASVSVIRKNMNLPRIDETEVVVRLKNLGFGVEAATVGKDRELSLLVPSWRLWDVVDSYDIIEEAARSIGLNRVKGELPPLDYTTPQRNPVETVGALIRPALRGAGFIEVITKGFYSATEVALLDSLEPGVASRHIALKNSLEQSNSHMKVTNVVHLTKLLAMNKRRGVESGKVYELCRFFVKPEPLPSDEPKPAVALDYDCEREMLTLASFGRWHESDWRKEEPLEEVARLFKGAITNLIKGIGGELSVAKSESSVLHPGMQGSIKVGRSVVGFFGVVHPIIREALDLKEPAMYAELDVALLHKLITRPQAPAVSDFPAVWRDITLRIGSREQAGRVLRFIKEMGLEGLVKVSIIDDFTKTGEDFRRVTYRANFQRLDRTLRSDEVDGAMTVLVDGLRGKHSIEVV
jgi:phenylalanyl-tRNA synthetase beta chain